VCGAFERSDRGDCRLRFLDQRVAVVGQLDPVSTSHEERDSEFPLELTHVSTERGLRDVKPSRGLREGAFLGDRNESAEMPHVHGWILLTQ